VQWQDPGQGVLLYVAALKKTYTIKQSSFLTAMLATMLGWYRGKNKTPTTNNQPVQWH